MASVTYSPGIQYINGALTKPKKVDGHKHGDYLIATHRTAPTTNDNCTRLYVRKADAYQRSTPVTAEEQVVRTHFAAVSRAVAARRKDLTKVAADLAAFNEQKDDPNGKKTLKAWYWMVCAEELNS